MKLVNLSIIMVLLLLCACNKKDTIPPPPGPTPGNNDTKPVINNVSFDNNNFHIAKDNNFNDVGTDVVYTVDAKNAVNYTWHFDDGSSDVTNSSPTFTHTYKVSGMHTTMLTATNQSGETVSTTITTQVDVWDGMDVFIVTLFGTSTTPGTAYTLLINNKEDNITFVGSSPIVMPNSNPKRLDFNEGTNYTTANKLPLTLNIASSTDSITVKIREHKGASPIVVSYPIGIRTLWNFALNRYVTAHPTETQPGKALILSNPNSIFIPKIPNVDTYYTQFSFRFHKKIS